MLSVPLLSLLTWSVSESWPAPVTVDGVLQGADFTHAPPAAAACVSLTLAAPVSHSSVHLHGGSALWSRVSNQYEELPSCARTFSKII